MSLPPEAPAHPTLELVGRDAELQAVRDALNAPATGGILLEGDAGIGKTALWQAGIADAEERGLPALVARPAEAESSLSYAALGDLIGPLADEFGGALPSPQRHALDVALLRASASGAVDGRAVGAAALAVLQAASRQAPLLLALDDVQWLDPASSAALGFALRRLAGEPVTLLATRRLGGDAGAWDVGLEKERLVRVSVGPLDGDALQRILQVHLGEPVPRPAVTRLAGISGGNPYYALELARAAMREAGSAGLTAELPLPEGIYAVLHDRLSGLPEATRDALGAVAAMGAPTVAAVSAAVDAGALDSAFASNVLREQGATVRFDHPLLAEAAYRLLPPSRRRAIHERLAELAASLEQRARHLAAGSTQPDSAIAADIEAGALEAAARGAPAAAAELLEASARLEPDGELAARRRIDAARQHAAAGDGRRAMALATALVEELPPGPLRARALVARSEHEGPIEELLELASQAVTEAGDDTEVLIEALLEKSVLSLIAGRSQEGRECAARAYELCGPTTARALRIQALSTHGEFAAWRDPRGFELLREATELEGDEFVPQVYWGPGTTLGRAFVFIDELDEGRRLLEPRHRHATDLGDDESRAGLALHLAELEIKQGRYDAAVRYGEEGLAIQKGSYAEEAQGSFSYVLALAHAHQGDAVRAREHGETGLAHCESQGDALFARMHRVALGFLELSLGDNAAAVEWLHPLAERFKEEPAEPCLPHNACIPDVIEALTGLDRLGEAEELLGVWDEAGERFDRPRVRASSARCRALVAAARGDLDAAGAHAEAAVSHSRELPVPFELARSLIVLGSLYRRTRKKAAARAALEEAVGILDPIGARLWAERARAELARISGRAPAGGLTPTEERVAELVAEGRSNKEVAEALFVSVRTVEANLTRIYAKLGIRSRAELMASRGGR